MSGAPLPEDANATARVRAGCRAVVWGLGRFGGGLGALLHLQRRGVTVRIMDRLPANELDGLLQQQGGLLAWPEIVPESEASLADCDLLVVNPAIPPGHPLLERARALGVPCTQELDLFLAAYPGRVLAVTGTNGKSTTASLMAEGLRALGRNVLLGGNIGRSLCIDEGAWSADQDAVLEVSSFQAARLTTRRLDTIVFTPILRDHVAWHGSIERYQSDKLRLLEACRPAARIHGMARCPVFTRASSACRDQHFVLLGSTDACEASQLRLDERRGLLLEGSVLIAPDEFPLQGRFNRENLLLALSALDLDASDVRRAVAGMQAFGGLPHRMAPAGSRQGVHLVDNGVSTVIETTRLALDVLAEELGPDQQLHLVAGGRPKEASLEAVYACLPGPAASLHLFGQISGELAHGLRERNLCEPTVSDRVTEALVIALERSRPGDTILFSPGFASQDQYPNFRARAEEVLAWWRDTTAQA